VKYELVQKSPGRWHISANGAGFEIRATTREDALQQAKQSLGGLTALASAIGVGVPTPKIAKATAVAATMTDAQLAAEVRRLEREISNLSGTTAPAASPAPAPHAARMAESFQDGASKPGVSFDGKCTQTFSLRGRK
jgi:hypothetical protein